MYKLIAIDMDGTLLNDNKEISEENRLAIQEAQHKGVKIVLATGRLFEGIQIYIDQLNLNSDDYVVCYSGAKVFQIETKKVISNLHLTGRDVKKIAKIALPLGVNLHGFTADGLITPKHNWLADLDANYNNIKVIETDYTKLADSLEVTKVMLVAEPEVLDTAVAKLPKFLDNEYEQVKSSKYFHEFLPLGCNKWFGVKKIADLFNIQASEVIGIGDEGNDLALIEHAGLGVAMANGSASVKASANFVTLSNQQSGVAHVIKKFIL